MNDKPPFIQALPRLSPDEIALIDKRHEGRVETLQALDDLVEAVVGKLSSAGVLDNAYIFFTSVRPTASVAGGTGSAVAAPAPAAAPALALLLALVC